MLNCLYQEFYKSVHRRIIYLAPLLIPIFMIIVRIASGNHQNNLLAMTNYDSNQIIPLVLIIVCSTLFTMEYQNNAILTVLYKAPQKVDIYLAKMLIACIYALILHLFSIICFFIFQLIPFISLSINWLSVYQYHSPLIINMINFNLVDLIASFLVISLVFVTSCIINSNSVVITTNILIVLIGQFVSSSLVDKNNPLFNILKWNPFNMLNLTNQYYNYGTYHLTTLLSNDQIILGTLGWSFAFLIIGYIIFKKKSF